MRFKKAFTLIELVFVLGLLAIILSIVLPTFKGLNDESNIAKANTELAILQTALETYYTEKNSYPLADYQQELIDNSAAKLITHEYIDPFNSFGDHYTYYKVPGRQSYVIYSWGLNRQPDFDPISELDFSGSSGKLKIDKKINDDLYVTNLTKEQVK